MCMITVLIVLLEIDKVIGLYGVNTEMWSVISRVYFTWIPCFSGTGHLSYCVAIN